MAETEEVVVQNKRILIESNNEHIYLSKLYFDGVQDLDLDDLIEPQTPQTFKPHGPHQFSSPNQEGDSVAAPVEKANVLAMLDEVTTLEDVRNLASDEDVEKWQSAIANYLINVKDEISLVKLQRVLQMPMVEVWLGLLLGGFTLEQRGDFYHNHNVWVKSSPSYYQ